MSPNRSDAGQVTVLAVEDDLSILPLLGHILRRAGYRVIPAQDGEEALRKIRTQLPDIVLTDLSMPVMDGVALTRALRNDPATRSLPVIAVTAHAWDQIGKAAVDAGIDGLVAKPFAREQLLSEVERCLAASRILNPPKPAA